MTGKIRIIGLVVGLFILFAGCSNEIENPGGIPAPPSQPDTPRDLYASIGDGQAAISWSINRPETVGHYKLYLSDSATVDGMRYLDSTSGQTYTVTNLINGKRYYFRAAIVDVSGVEGEMSNAITVTPGIFSMTIENYKEYINKRQVNINLIAPAGAELVELSEDSNFGNNVHLVSFNNIVQFELSDGDGVKKVFARFDLLGGGSSIGSVSDSIILDQVAIIDSVTFSTGGGQAQPGGTIHFALYSTEIGGQAGVSINNQINIDLNDHGIAGDATANDGIYEVDYVIPVNTDVKSAAVSGVFVDAAGNQAAQVTAVTSLSIVDLPIPVQLTGFAETSSKIILQWTKSAATDFSTYRIFRSTDAGVDQSSDLVTTISQIATTSYTNTDLDASTTYYYRIYVYDNDGNFAESNSLEITTQVNQPPKAVVLAVRLTGDTLEVELTWEKSEAEDFKAYHILRDNSTLPVYDAAKVVKLISGNATTSFTDKVPANGIYYYRVYVFDAQGASSGSNEVSVNVP